MKFLLSIPHVALILVGVREQLFDSFSFGIVVKRASLSVSVMNKSISLLNFCARTLVTGPKDITGGSTSRFFFGFAALVSFSTNADGNVGISYLMTASLSNAVCVHVSRSGRSIGKPEMVEFYKTEMVELTECGIPNWRKRSMPSLPGFVEYSERRQQRIARILNSLEIVAFLAKSECLQEEKAMNSYL